MLAELTSAGPPAGQGPSGAQAEQVVELTNQQSVENLLLGLNNGDLDGDGLSDEDEGMVDTDGDQTPNYADPDSDNDGAPDADEQMLDRNSNDVPDYIDAEPSDQRPDIEFTNRDFLLVDGDGNGLVSGGDTLLYSLTARNHGLVTASRIEVSDLPASETALITGSVTTSAGTVELGNSSGDQQLLVRIERLAPQQSIQLSFQVTVQTLLSLGESRNQAAFSFLDLDAENQRRAVLSDDPDTGEENDPTATTLGARASPASVLFLPLVNQKEP